MFRELIILSAMISVLLLSCQNSKCDLTTFGKIQYCYLFANISQREETQVIHIKNFDYHSEEDLILIQRLSLDYRHHHSNTTKYPFTGLLFTDQYYPVADMFQFKGIRISIYFTNDHTIRQMTIYKNREKVDVKIPSLPPQK